MSDAGFDARLERLFSQPSRVYDPDGFARRVEARLDREWSLRRGFIGAAGVAGGLIAVGKALGTDAYERLAGAAAPLGRQAEAALATNWSLETQTQALLNGQGLWVLAAVAGLVATLAVVRAAESF